MPVEEPVGSRMTAATSPVVLGEEHDGALLGSGDTRDAWFDVQSIDAGDLAKADGFIPLRSFV
jgi:hypothetical protein